MDETEAITVRLSELLRHPEDLDKIPALKSDFTRKKAHVDTQLKTGLKNQLEVTEAGINALTNGQKTLNVIKDEMMRIDKLCAEAENMIAEFPLINKISKIHRNFVAVEDIKSNLEGLHTQLSEVDQMLQADDNDELTNPMRNLLPIHYALTQLQDFRDDVMEQSEQTADSDVRKTLESYFSPLENTIDLFNERVGLIAMSLIDLVRAENRGLVVRLAKIIEAEERADEKVVALKEAQEAHEHLASKFKSIARGPKAVRGYKQKFLDCIRAAAEAKFENARNNFEDDPDQLAEYMQWYFDDLEVVKHEFPRLFPPKWKIFDTILDIYHNLMHDFLKEYLDKEDLDGQSLLSIILWNGQYSKGMKKLGIKAADMVPHVIDNREADLLREYSQLIASKMEEWMNNIIEDDTREFVLRENQPNEENGKWHMPSVPTMFTMINQQLNVALDSNKGNVVASVIEECVRLLKNRQFKWEQVIEDEIGKHMRAVTKEEQEDLPDGILEYMIAVANDQLRCAAYTQEIADSKAQLLSKKYEDQVRAALDDATNGFVDLATFCMGQLIEIIFNDLKPIRKTLFTSSWYGGNEMETIITTIRSYVVDIEGGLDEDLFAAFMHQLSEQTCVTYLSGAYNKGAKFRIGESAGQIRADVALGYGFFIEYIDRGEVKAVWSVLEHFLALVCTEKEALPDKYEAFKDAYWDLPICWVEQVIKCREDKTRDMLESVKQRAVYMPRGQEPTIMSRYARVLAAS
ncbi:exocyst complex component Sec6-domain-containing protein [Sphaerosporella brunnea]|uniref:Exocyst complex component Sec6-domain-containing protein n=1 Tax=Sphaerosporella brunnea TaxID=1250544 RepID=A0A5J5EPC5_9PEZI|nr:exocyst complex component Sec6-domain-containing protein [Sphaerosporella brunnea]